jgi:hypothetical protein
MEEGVYANQRFSLTEGGKAYGRKAKVSNRTGEIPPSGIIGGPRETAGTASLYDSPPPYMWAL